MVRILYITNSYSLGKFTSFDCTYCPSSWPAANISYHNLRSCISPCAIFYCLALGDGNEGLFSLQLLSCEQGAVAPLKLVELCQATASVYERTIRPNSYIITSLDFHWHKIGVSERIITSNICKVHIHIHITGQILLSVREVHLR